MAHGDLRGFDLNLLVTLDALLQERSVTSAARRLGISQPAASQALARLRRHFDDELLARQGGSYALTPKASGLLDELAELLDRAKLVVEGESDFNPLSSDREFRLMCSDYAAVVIGSELSNRLASSLPHGRLRLVSMEPHAASRFESVARRFDGLVLPRGILGSAPALDLLTDEWVCVADAASDVGNGGRLTVEEARRSQWVLTYLGQETQGPGFELLLKTFKIEPRVTVVCESYLAVPSLVIGSDRLALCQSRLAREYVRTKHLKILQPPVPVRPINLAMWWSPQLDKDPGHQWFRHLVAETASRLAEVAS